MSELVTRLEDVKRTLMERCKTFPKFVLVLGSGLGGLADDIELETEIPYDEIPHFKPISVEGHVGKLRIGRLGNQRVACMLGRLHYYEGHSMSDVVFPVRAFAWAGAEAFLLTNAAGGLLPEMKPLDFLLIRDHINLMGTNPLIGPNAKDLGPRFPDMTHIYDKNLGNILKNAAEKLNIAMSEGVYVGNHGPTYETPAEIRMYRTIGGSAVGMSTVPEALALRHMDKRVVGLSCITNMAAGVTPAPLEHADVLNNAGKIYQHFSKLMKESIAQLGEEIGVLANVASCWELCWGPFFFIVFGRFHRTGNL